jgi:hypothetical protein
MAKSKKILVRYCGKGGDVFTIQRVRRPDPCIDEVALVQFQTHLAGDMLLCGGDKGTQSFAQRAEPLAIIHQFAKGDGQLTLLVGGELVQRQSFQHFVGFVQDGAAGGLIDAAALHAHKTVLHYIVQADAVAAADPHSALR